MGGMVFGWLSFISAFVYSCALFALNLSSFPSNVGVSEWWGSELAIRYCSGFVRRGILGQTAWSLTSLFDKQSAYVVVLSTLMALSSVILGFLLLYCLRKKLSLLPALLVLFSPTAYPVMLTHAGSLFRKDAFQLCLFFLILLLVKKFDESSSSMKRSFLYCATAGLQIFAVLNHEPFALLILPALFLARLFASHGYRDALMFSVPGVATFLLAAAYKGRPQDVSCLQTSLQSIGLLPPGARPGSSITELALTKPSFFTWDLTTDQLAWSLLHAILAICITWSCYLLIARRNKICYQPWKQAGLFLLIQLLVALPLYMATIDYGRWFAMLACAGMLALLTMPTGESLNTRKAQMLATKTDQTTARIPLVLLSLGCLFVVPTHCCTYAFAQIFTSVPYSGIGIWKQLLTP